MAQNRYRRVETAEGEIIAQISAPPTITTLVNGNKQSDIQWKDYIFTLFDFVTALSYVYSEFTAPNLTTAERDALTAVNGMIIYNTTTNQFNFYENGAWVTK